jgi:SAM-dependent methyltransferase
MELKDVQANWDQFGKIDPLWAIIADSTKRGGKWNMDEFFATGRIEIAEVMAYVQALPISLLKKGRALDFGCGVGRLTQALCDHFAECHGVDIAPSMIELAEKYNRFGTKCHYHLNSVPNLSLFTDDSFDLIYSNLVLQHMHPKYSTAYIKEFVRVLAPGGLAVFQLPGEIATPKATGLPERGFKAQITIGDFLMTLPAQAEITIAVRVKNISSVTWPTTGLSDDHYRIRLGNHWLDRRGRTIVMNDGRVRLPHDVQPQEEIELSLPIHAPKKSGEYILELDMVQEQVAWFKTKGSTPATVPIRVVGDQQVQSYTPASHTGWPDRLRRMFARMSGDRPGAQDFRPVMEMHCLPQPEVMNVVQQTGGRTLDIQRHDFPEQPWIFYRYFVTK